MTETTNTLNAALGIALQTLLRNARGTALRELIDAPILDTTHGLDPNSASDGHLGELAANLVEPSTALRDAQIPEHIIRMLPLPKTRGLGQRMGAKDGSTLYNTLCSKPVDHTALEILYLIFGVVRDSLAPAGTSPNAQQLPAGYPLFDHQRTATGRVVDALASSSHKIVLHMPFGSGETRTIIVFQFYKIARLDSSDILKAHYGSDERIIA